MQRSTVSMIVDALIVEAMIEAVGKSESTGRRCPKLLRLNGDGAAAFGIDISPTRTTVAKGDISGQVLDFTEFPTDPDFEKTISRAIDCVIELTRNGTKRIEGVRVIVAGLVNPERGTIPYVPCFNRRNSM
jgi:predicted NBD/HSP70 family sugar kinase